MSQRDCPYHARRPETQYPGCTCGDHALALDEGERQMALLALAVLSLESPGFDDMLNRMAMRIDNTDSGRAKTYDVFRRLRDDVSGRVVREILLKLYQCVPQRLPIVEVMGEPVAVDLTIEAKALIFDRVREILYPPRPDPEAQPGG